jgi:Cdc25 family phosphatase
MTAPFIDVETVASWLKDPTKIQGTDFQIIDVRDLDFKGGNIVGAKNIPLHTIQENPTAILEKLNNSQSTPPKKLVFHCALSQQRGPKAANTYLRMLNDELYKKVGGVKEQEVLVLRGGFEGFQEKYREDKELVENFDPSLREEY